MNCVYFYSVPFQFTILIAFLQLIADCPTDNFSWGFKRRLMSTPLWLKTLMKPIVNLFSPSIAGGITAVGEARQTHQVNSFKTGLSAPFLTYCFTLYLSLFIRLSKYKFLILRFVLVLLFALSFCLSPFHSFLK